MDLGLAARRVLITGGSQGIGYAVAQGFLAEGAHVVIAARDAAKLDRAVAALAAAGSGRVEARSVDLSQPGSAEALASACPDTDILVNNAGSIPIGDIFEVDEARWRAAWDLKVFGYVNLTRAMYARMRGRPPKAIINILGTGADKPQWRYACGTPANIALAGLTKAMGGRSIDDGIRILAVSPGAVETERWRAIHMQRAKEKLGDAARWREALLDQPQNRAASVEEVANVVVFLASERASWVCGEIVNVDGGRLFREQWF
jgi:NAD(P)-dependent dehydrogenase (short-subunit alcohol dehydrogenase family)